MTPPEYQELKQQPEAKDYRSALAAALSIARKYDGAEEQYGQLMAALEHLEEVVETSPSITAEGAQAKEIEAAIKFAPLRPRDIQDVLSVASESQRRAIQAALAEKKAKSNLLIRRIKGVFLPTGAEAGPIQDGEGDEFRTPRFEERLSELLEILNQLNVYTDDLLITRGENPQGVRREESYLLVEIPRLGRAVLVNNEVGEATFVLRESIPHAVLQRLSKEVLQTTYFDKVHRVVRYSPEQWQEEIKTFLTVEQAWDTSKVNVRDLTARRDAVIQLIRAQFTPEEWMNLEFKQRKEQLRAKAAGYTPNRLSRLLGTEDASSSNLYFWQIGTIIWPEDQAMTKAYLEAQEELAVRQMDAAQLRLLVQTKMTPEQWLQQTVKSAREIFISNVGVSFLAKKFGIAGSPYQTRIAYLELGQEIWPEDQNIKHALEVERWTGEEWKAAMRKATTPEAWASMRQKEVMAFSCEGKGINFIARKLGIQEWVNGVVRQIFQIGRQIWPDREDLWSQVVKFGVPKGTRTKK